MSVSSTNIDKWKEVLKLPTTGSLENFYKTVQLVIEKPQVLSKSCAGAVALCKKDLRLKPEDIESKFIESFSSVVFQKLSNESVTCWQNIIEVDSDHLEKILDSYSDKHSNEILPSSDAVQCILQLSIPKSLLHAKMITVCLIASDSVIYVPLLEKDGDSFKRSTDAPYKIMYIEEDSQSYLQLSMHGLEETQTQSLISSLKKFKHYCDTELTYTTKMTLQLVNFDKYNDLYNRMKNQYAEYLISNWTENTDPKKYVFEDIAIAAYLIMIFEEERMESGVDKKQTFLDIGCGNGLLVYLLHAEGYRGTGIDLRSRNIWNWFQDHGVDLKEAALNPSADTLFPEYDWLIGNHSDEMTPWIPVISARSSYNCRFFVLPCCPHDFNGKFRERKSQLSVYQSYLDYVEEIVDVCGFIPERDKLKIPSTKRICIIGRRRNYTRDDENTVDTRRHEFIQYRCQRLLESNDSSTAICGEDLGFVPRAKDVKVRNCTQVDRGIQSRIVSTVFATLLETRNEVQVNDKSWNRGGSISLSDLVEKFSPETLKELKNECGGLQTLLKNHRQIFSVVQGRVSLRYGEDERRRPAKKRSSRGVSKNYHKSCPCYFFTNHPDGCWQSAELCSYAHGDQDLKTVTETL